MAKRIFHVDIDAFFASVEQIDDPSLVGKPVIVGAAPGHRGVVSTCSYEARAFGVRSAMPISEAQRRCPQAVFLPVRMERYAELSKRVMGIFGGFTPGLRQISVDEAFLDMTGTERLWGRPAEAAMLLKARVRDETGLGISIGIAANHYIAKIASGIRKPDGLVLVEEGEEEAFMLSLPLAKLWGAGERTQERFRELGIVSVVQLSSIGRDAIRSLFGRAGGDFLYEASRGRDPGMFGGEPGSRSVSCESTFERDTADRESVEAVLMSLVDELCYRLWAEGSRSRTIVLKMRFSDFTTISRRIKRASPFSTADEALKDALALLAKAWDGRAELRLVGIGFAELESGRGELQGELFSDPDIKRRKAEEAIFEIERSGLGSVRRARLVDKDGRGRKPRA